MTILRIPDGTNQARTSPRGDSASWDPEAKSHEFRGSFIDRRAVDPLPDLKIIESLRMR
jgi:hypothetical protein